MISCVIPAAGTSSRMGGQWKLMLPFKGGLIIDQVLSTALRCADQVILVIGHEALRMQEYLQSSPFADEHRLIIVVNEEYRTGMFSSIRRGVESVGYPDWFILPADMPLLCESHIRPLLDRYRDGQGTYDVLRPVHQDIPGHPVFFGAGMRERVLAAPQDGSMREILSHIRLRLLDVDDPAYITDIDTLESYRLVTNG